MYELKLRRSRKEGGDEVHRRAEEDKDRQQERGSRRHQHPLKWVPLSRETEDKKKQRRCGCRWGGRLVRDGPGDPESGRVERLSPVRNGESRDGDENGCWAGGWKEGEREGEQGKGSTLSTRLYEGRCDPGTQIRTGNYRERHSNPSPCSGGRVERNLPSHLNLGRPSSGYTPCSQ